MCPAAVVPGRDGTCQSSSSSPVVHETASPRLGTVGLGVLAPGTHSQESNFHAMVMPPISESLNRSRKVPSGLLMSRSCACCLLTKPRMALGRAGVSGPGSGPGWAGLGGSYPSFQCGFRCFFSTSMTPSNHCQKV